MAMMPSVKPGLSCAKQGSSSISFGMTLVMAPFGGEPKAM
jgi:hypothetical protein